MNTMTILFFLMVFASVFLLLQSVPLRKLIDSNKVKRQMTLESRSSGKQNDTDDLLLRRPDLASLSSLGRYFQRHDKLAALRRLIDQSGLRISVYRIIAEAAALAAAAALVVALLQAKWWLFLIAVPAASSLPLMRLFWLLGRRIARIEQQLADAIDMAKRSLRAGNPFVSTFRLVAESMSEPIAAEFAITAADMSYGNDPRQALFSLAERVPSVPLRGFVTAILVQRETGGNLAETLDHLSDVIRQRFRFDRKLRALSAEGRLSAWVLIAIPFALAGLLQISSPEYLTRLLDDPRGPTLLGGAGVLMIVGIVWIRQIARVEI